MRALLFVILLNGFSAISQMTVTEHLVTEGLSQNMVNAIAQDYLGFMWFGTNDGLNRYDGFNYEVYQNDPDVRHSLIDNHVIRLLEDRQHNLWVGTSKGLCIYDRKKDAFIPLAFGNRGIAESQDEISALYEDSRGNVWAATNLNEVICFSPGTGTKPDQIRSQILTLPIREGHKRALTVHWMVEDKFHTLWLSASDRICTIQPQGDKGWKVEDHTLAHRGGWTSDRNLVLKDRSGELWFYRASGYFKCSSGDSIKLLPSENLPDILGDGLLDLGAASWIQADDGKFWLTGPGRTPCTLDLRSGRMEPVFDRVREGPDGIKAIWGSSSLFKDRSGNIWLGHLGEGLSIYSQYRRIFENSPGAEKIISPSARDILKTRDGIVWCVVEGDRLHRFDPKAKEFVAMTDPNRATEPLYAKGIIEDADGSLWACHASGLAHYYRKGEAVTKMDTFRIRPLSRAGNPFSWVYNLVDDGEGFIWLAGRYELWKFNKRTHELKSIVFLDPKKERNTEGFLQFNPDLYMQGDSLIWFSTTEGLKYYHRKKKHFRSFPWRQAAHENRHELVIRTITPDPRPGKPYLWLATAANGLVRFNPEDKSFHFFKRKEGLIDNCLYAARADQQGNLWLSSNNGLMRFALNDYSVQGYSVRDGLQNNEFNIHAEHVAFDGELFFGGIGGINRFYPARIQQSQFKCPTRITEIQVNNKAIDHRNSGGRLKLPLSIVDELILFPEDRIVTIRLAALDFTAPEKNQFAYFLEGFDDEWQFVGTSRTLTFTNLEPGEYTLKVKSSNSNGQWSDQITQLRIIVVPPWYANGWAYSIYTLLALALILWIYRFQLRRQMERQERMRLHELDSVKTKFFTNISHEFRTPLTLIKGMSETLNAAFVSRDEEKFRKNVAVLERNSGQLLSLVNQLLDISKIDAGMMTVELKSVDLQQFVQNTVAAFDSSARMKDLDLAFKCTAKRPVVEGDIRALTHIVQNLISNAIKFTHIGKVEITIEESEPGYVKLAVQDTGIGIAPGQLPHIFDRFYQADDSSTRAYEGTGVGLALTKELVHMMDASITAESTLGVGSRFEIILQRSEKQPAEKELGVPSLVRPKVNTTPMPDAEVDDSFPTILLVEDNLDMQFYISEILQEEYNVVLAINGVEGLQKAREMVPDFIITDWMMPELSGPEMLQQLKADTVTSHIPCMLLTARADQESKLTGYRYGAESYLTKPFAVEELKAQTAVLIETRNMLRRYLGSVDREETAETPYNAETEFLNKVSELLQVHLSEPDLNGDFLAAHIFLSRSQFARKLRAITGLSVTQFIRNERIRAAKNLLRQGKLNISEVAFEVGFSDPAYFSRIFSAETGMSPSDYQNGMH